MKIAKKMLSIATAILCTAIIFAGGGTAFNS